MQHLKLTMLALTAVFSLTFLGCQKDLRSDLPGITSGITANPCCKSDYSETLTTLFECGDLKITAQNNGTQISVNIHRSGSDANDHFTQVDYEVYNSTTGTSGTLTSDNCCGARQDFTFTFTLPANWVCGDGYNIHCIVKGLGGLNLPACNLQTDEDNSGKGKLEINKPFTVGATVPPAPAAISGPSTVCAGSNITLSDATAGGTWSSNNTLVATVNATTGVVTGVTPGPATITYTVTVNGCSNTATKIITVNACTCTTRTQSLGYWKNSNRNGTALISLNWATKLAPGVTIGCGGGVTKTFSTQSTLQAAITNYLGTPAVLTTTGGLSTFSAQLLALSINLKFWPATGNMVVISGPFATMTVNQVLALANNVIGGCNTSYTPSQMTNILDIINNSYDGGVYNGIPTLTCPQ